MQNFAEFWPHLVDIAFYSAMAAGVIILGLVAVISGNGRASANGNGEGTVEPEEAQLHRRRQQGGNAWKEMLWQMKAVENRRMDTFIRRLADTDTSEEDRRLCAEQIAISRNQLDSIDAMLLFREAE